MFTSEITWWDFIWLAQSIVIVSAVMIAYREGEKNGEKKGYEKAKKKRRSKHYYKLPTSTALTPDTFLEELPALQNVNHYKKLSRNSKRRMNGNPKRR